MIELKKLNGVSIYINPDLIRSVEQTPDTLVSFTDGDSLLVQNTPRDIVEKIVRYRRDYTLNHDENLTDEAEIT